MDRKGFYQWIQTETETAAHAARLKGFEFDRAAIQKGSKR